MVSLQSWLICLPYIIAGLKVTSGLSPTGQLFFKRDFCYRVEPADAEVTVTSSADCASKCLASTGFNCSSFQFTSTDKSCKLSSSSPVESVFTPDSTVQTFGAIQSDSERENSCLTPPQPTECQSAINLTEYWRKDHSGSNIQPNGAYNCDTRDMNNNYPERPWFRFKGDAGNAMLDSCPPGYSCGTHAAMWTDQAMPSEVGEATTISAFASWSGNCKSLTKPVLVMRCSNDNSYDFVYKFDDSYTGCNYGFCGMTKV